MGFASRQRVRQITASDPVVAPQADNFLNCNGIFKVGEAHAVAF
jgi:hypothetical protein